MPSAIEVPLLTIIIWLIVGLIGGWVSSKLRKINGIAMFGYMILGMIGACLSGYLFCLIVRGEARFWGSIICAALGTHLIIAIARFLGFKRRES